jgi:uncharacterized protein YfbU (UPF0304 family)
VEHAYKIKLKELLNKNENEFEEDDANIMSTLNQYINIQESEKNSKSYKKHLNDETKIKTNLIGIGSSDIE